jgi:CheY-like chemotaxis protein
VLQLVEDDDVTRDVLARVLREEGYLVAEATDGLEALEQLRGGLKPNLILLDMMLPGLDGWQVLKARDRNPALATVPVLIITAVGIASDAWASSLGAAGLLHKPVEPDTLLAEVERCCA